MFDGVWNQATMNCRGLIVGNDYKIVARPFPKFFSQSQCESFKIKIPFGEDFEVFDKFDGSLGISYWIGDEMFIATRGSFTSDQAIEANKILKEKYSHVHFDSRYTFLFEIIYPANRIVVDYGNKRDLILLAIIKTSTGEEFPYSEFPKGLPVINRYHGIKDFSKVLEQFDGLPGTEFEGLVIRFSSGFRVKVKTEDYKKLHSIYTGLSERDIWKCISSGIGLKEIVDVAPDELFGWIQSVEKNLRNEYSRVDSLAKMLYLDAKQWADNDKETRHQKSFALFVLKCDNKVLQSVAFQMYQNNKYEEIIWNSLYPDGNKKFKILSEVEE
jgi:T4 RnlA family RNA ligase